MTQEVEDCFSAKKNAGAIFVDLTAAYDTVRTLVPYLQGSADDSLPDERMVRIIMEFVQNCSFQPVMENKAGCDVSKTAFPRNLSWSFSSSTLY